VGEQGMIDIDGSQGEGGGQVLRTSLGLSMVTGKPFRIRNVRAGRKKPGLLRQHLTAATAAARICSARIVGAELGSKDLVFEPGPVTPGKYHFAVGTAGSATLVLQAVLPALLRAGGPTALALEGGTHNPFAPPYPFLALSYLPVLNRMGARVNAELLRPGFYPAGGGKLAVRVEPVNELQPLRLDERGAVRSIRATILIAHLPANSIGPRERAVLLRELDLREHAVEIKPCDTSAGPGNVVYVTVECENMTAVFSAFGARGRSSESVAGDAAAQVRAYLESGVPVDEHLADQLLIPMALAGAGGFTTVAPSSHTQTNIRVIEQFLDVGFGLCEIRDGAYRIELGTTPKD